MNLKIALGQINPGSKSVAENVKWAIEGAALAAQQGAKILCLPELFPFGLLKGHSQVETAAAVTVDILDILRENAQSNDIAIMAGLPYA
ncbi:MAG: carbon-nitrogen hydrolase family protein, partial [Thermodesulfobacteria bacterium]|nr:carbon-nitrogen hydrolase family protein [Thermodesulfobacteriota bacterium]